MISISSARKTLDRGQPIYCYTHGSQRYRVIRIGRKECVTICGRTLAMTEILSFDDGMFHGGMGEGKGFNYLF